MRKGRRSSTGGGWRRMRGQGRGREGEIQGRRRIYRSSYKGRGAGRRGGREASGPKWSKVKRDGQEVWVAG